MLSACGRFCRFQLCRKSVAAGKSPWSSCSQSCRWRTDISATLFEGPLLDAAMRRGSMSTNGSNGPVTDVKEALAVSHRQTFGSSCSATILVWVGCQRPTLTLPRSATTVWEERKDRCEITKNYRNSNAATLALADYVRIPHAISVRVLRLAIARHGKLHV